jgi:hypothetical protein
MRRVLVRRRELGAAGAPTLQILTNGARVPWELMVAPAADGAEEFVGIGWRVARWHLAAAGRQRDVPPAGAIPARIFAIAPEYPPSMALASQRAEIEALRRAAGDGFEPVGGDYRSLRGLFASRGGPRGVVHFAGHGQVVDGAGPAPEFELLLADSPLTVPRWTSMAGDWTSGRPLVFLNACDLGEARRVAGTVDGWAPAFLDAGASGFVGGLWPLGDRAAADFSARFYERALAGDTVPDALRAVRRRVYETGDPTYLAYVFYGSPGLRLTR